MSIGFSDAVSEFHTTTAHAPHKGALPELLGILAWLLDGSSSGERILKWNRDPEEFDFRFSKAGEEAEISIYQYPTGDRLGDEPELAYSHRASVREVCDAFYATFAQLYEDRETDEFEFNWRQPFPVREFRNFEARLKSDG
jgi:hypothetical protein